MQYIVTSGIPQGSVLGPILFVIYINDLPDVVKHSETYLFADDTKLFKQINSIQLNIELQEDLEALQSWSDRWLLRFHPDKCEVLPVKPKKPRDYNYQLKSTRGTTRLKLWMLKKI